MNPDTFIVVAALNEADRIEATLDALAGAFPGAPVWVADDGSTDATSDLARAAGVNVVRSERVIGKGQAMTAAARAAAEASAATMRAAEASATAKAATAQAADAGGVSAAALEPIFLLCDGDLGRSAAELLPLVQAVREGRADVAVAAFAQRVGGGFGLARGFARWAIRRRCGLLTSAPISGQRALSGDALATVLPFAAGFGMEIGITIDAVRAGRRVVELELELEHRATGRTLAGFGHRARQLLDFAHAYGARRQRAAG